MAKKPSEDVCSTPCALLLTILEGQKVEDGVEHGDYHSQAQQPRVALDEDSLHSSTGS